MKTKLWLDDVRKPPDDSWYWARSAEQAQIWMGLGSDGFPLEEMSLDHDLGFGHADLDAYENADFEELLVIGEKYAATGYDFVVWLTERQLVPPVVTIHSWNPPGAKNMAARLERWAPKCKVRIEAYKE